MYWKDSCFSDCWKVSLVLPEFKNAGKSSAATNNWPVNFLSMVSKVFGKLVNNRLADLLEKYGLLSDLQYGFRSSRSVADGIARTFIKSGTTIGLVLLKL